jgi:cyclin-dependent kinase 12/13
MKGSTFLVFDYMIHDFAGLFKSKRVFSLPETKCIVRQLLEGVAYLHARKILHRDIKSANILLNDEGQVKLADFGLGRKVHFENVFTYKVVTLWYRAPELILGCKNYSDKIDVWSIGCVVAEFFLGEVLFKSMIFPTQSRPSTRRSSVSSKWSVTSNTTT